MAIKKSEIYGTIEAACDELRGGMEPSIYKDYILTLLFVKYVSDKYAGDPMADIVIPEGGSFADISAAKEKTNAGELVNIAISKLAAANGLKGIIDRVDFNSTDLGDGNTAVAKVSNLIRIFEKSELNFASNRAAGDDILGDAYEYLMHKFAKDAGKSKGQFYTPGEVSRIMAQLIEIDKSDKNDVTLYDPACGSGSLLIRAADEAPKRKDGTSIATIYGQELGSASLAKMNLVIHNHASGEIVGMKSTMSSPAYKDRNNADILQTFDYVVVNPPFSDKAWSSGMDKQYGRFDGYGMPPEKNGDFAWLLHVIKSMKPETGKAAVILPHGVLFRGNAEADIREKIIKKGYIKGIIGLPANLFFGTGIPACILILDKEGASEREGIFMIDASKGFIKDGNKNRLREQDIHQIVSVFKNRTEIPKYSRFVKNDEIYTKNEFNLNIPRYIDSSIPEDIQDINAHLNGGIPMKDIDSLEEYWSVYPTIKNELFSVLRDGYYKVNVGKEDITSHINSHHEFVAHAQVIESAFKEWSEKTSKILYGLSEKDNAKGIVKNISELMLESFEDVPLLHKYDVYQVLMEYVHLTMQDDIYAICFEGYKAGSEIEVEYVTKKKGKEVIVTDTVKSFEGRLIPKSVMIDVFYSELYGEVKKAQMDVDLATSEKENLIDEYSCEDGLMVDFVVDDKFKADLAKKKIKELSKQNNLDEDDLELMAVLKQFEELLKREKMAKDKLKLLSAELDSKLYVKYKELSIEDVKKMLIEDKWYSNIFKAIEELHNSVSYMLSNRLVELVERYDCTLSECNSSIDEYEKKVEEHLKRMGYVW